VALTLLRSSSERERDFGFLLSSIASIGDAFVGLCLVGSSANAVCVVVCVCVAAL
jgi:hypothetical protein